MREFEVGREVTVLALVQCVPVPSGHWLLTLRVDGQPIEFATAKGDRRAIVAAADGLIDRYVARGAMIAREAAEARAAAEAAERAATFDPLAVSCPLCGAEPGAPCVQGSERLRGSHLVRIDAAADRLPPEPVPGVGAAVGTTVTCRTCGGVGHRKLGLPHPCAVCNGFGTVTEVRRVPLDTIAPPSTWADAEAAAPRRPYTPPAARNPLDGCGAPIGLAGWPCGQAHYDGDVTVVGRLLCTTCLDRIARLLGGAS